MVNLGFELGHHEDGEHLLSADFICDVAIRDGRIDFIGVRLLEKNSVARKKIFAVDIFDGHFNDRNNIAAQVGMKTISAGMAAVLNYTAPLWTAILAHFTLNERLTEIKCFGIFLAIVGLYVLMGLQGVEDLHAAFIIILGAMVMGVSNIIVKLKLSKCDMVQLTTWQMIFGALVLVTYTSLVPQGEINWCVPAVLCVIYNGALASAVAFLLWNYVLTHMEAGKAAIATLVAPVVGVLGGVIFLTVQIVAGIILIFAGILIVVRKRKNS